MSMRIRQALPPAVCVLLAAAPAAVPAAADLIPGKNVNMVAGTGWPGGDPFLQRQNEGSVAVNARNWLHLLGGGNDYRTVDLAAALTGGRVVGDAWHGVFKSTDGGNTWRSTLLPGYPLDTSPEGLASPLRGYQAGADPVVRAGTNGLFYYSGIVFDRDPRGKGALFVARFIDLNNKENGDPIRYVDTRLIDTGTAGQFIDKPWMAVDRPRAGAATCTFELPQQGGNLAPLEEPQQDGTVTQSFPGGNVYVSYTIFLGNENVTRTKLMLARSRDCGATWTRTKLSEGFPLNQGSTIAIEPASGTVYVAWRQFKTSHVPDAILIAKSTDGGATFTKASQVGLLTPFEQGTTPVSIRINSYPVLAAWGGRLYLVYSEKGPGPGGDARIVIRSSTDGVAWTSPMVAVNDPGRGHQFYPALSVVQGRLLLAYYALKEDNTYGVLTPAGGGQYTETRELAGDLEPPAPEPAKVFTDFLMEVPPAGFGYGPLKRRHTVDVWVAEAEPGPAPVFQAVRASRYLFGSRPASSLIEQFQFNPPLLKMFQLGTVPFFSDYVEVAGRAFRRTPTGWVHDDGLASGHIVWTDNRDVRPPLDGDWTNYTPVTSGAVGGTSKFDPSQPVPACVVGQTGMRNQNLYTVRVTRGLYLGSPGNAKPLGLIQRAFVVFAQNTRDVAASYRFTIANQPAGGQASLLQSGLLTTLDVLIPARSTASRSVFVTSSDPDASVTVNVEEVTGPGGVPVPGGPSGEIVLNADPTTPDISNPDISNPDISNPDISNAETHNPDISNPDISNPDISNPDISNPDISNPDISNYEVANPDISNPDISNPDISNPDISNGAIADTSWTATNEGNTASSFTVKLLKNSNPPPGFKLQLVTHGIYTTPVAQDCDLKIQTHNVLIANVPNPPFATLANFTDPDVANPSAVTLGLAPGQTARITLRVVDPNRFDVVTWSAAEQVVPVVVAHAANTGETQPPFAVGRPILLFATPPTNTEARQAIVPPIQVKALDDQGDPLPGVSVTVAIGNNPGGGTLSGTTTRATDALGLATFPGLTIDAAGKGYTLVASAPGTFGATSAPFDVDALITFERFPDGTPACASCPLTDQFATRGVVFSFVSAFTPLTSATLFDSVSYDPPGGPLNHSVSAARDPVDGGFWSGTVVMDYAALPTTVVFRLRSNDSIPIYPVAAFDPSGGRIPDAQITRSDISTYVSPGGFLFRQETVTITNAAGVAQVRLDMDGFKVDLDNLMLQ